MIYGTINFIAKYEIAKGLYLPVWVILSLFWYQKK